MCANDRVHYGPTAVFVCLYITLAHYHHYAELSEGIGFLKYLFQLYSVECVSKIKSILSIIFHEAVCIRFIHFSYVDCENEFTLC